MRKKISYLSFVFLLIFIIFSVEVKAFYINPTLQGKISLSYKIDGYGIEGLDIAAYRVAALLEDGTYELLEPYTDYPVSLESMLSLEEGKHAASTLASYVKADHLEAYCTNKSDRRGEVLMERMTPGLYLILGSTVQRDDSEYLFGDYFVYLPAKGSDGEYHYHVQAIPKYELIIPTTEYKVVKFWKDEEGKEKRPSSIEVEILKDGVLEEICTLNAENNWSYSWETTDLEGQWSVIEKNAGDSYYVEIIENEAVFHIINTYKEEPEDPEEPEEPKEPESPQDDEGPSDIIKTGDSAPVMLYLMIMCISGMVLLLVGIRMKRKTS